MDVGDFRHPCKERKDLSFSDVDLGQAGLK